MILLLGTDAYSPFRLDAIKDAIAKLSPALGPVSIDAKWVYAILPAAGGATADELERAASLLNAGAECSPAAQDASTFFVTPRKGTISPWSSKATDIFRNCGLAGIARVERGIRFTVSAPLPQQCYAALFDKMTEGVYDDIADLFAAGTPKPGRTYDVLAKGVDAIREANEEIGLAISEPEMEYLARSFAAAGRNPTDTELVMFGQVNSEHCRHKIFGAKFIIDGKEMPESLFGMIKNTHALGIQGQLRRRRRFQDGRLRHRPRDEPLRLQARTARPAYEGRDPQPPDGDFPLSGRGDRCRR